MEVSIFDPAASVVYANNTGNSAEDTVRLSTLIPFKTGMSIDSITREEDVDDGGLYINIKVVVYDSNWNGGELPAYSAPAELIGQSDFEIPDMETNKYLADYAGVLVCVWALDAARKENKKAKERKLTKDNSVVIS